MGRGNVDIDSYVRKYVELCPRLRNPVEGDHDSGAKAIRIPAGSRSPIPEPSRSVIPG